MTSNCSSFFESSLSALPTSMARHSWPSSIPHLRRFRTIASVHLWFLSTKTTFAAPLLAASIPTLPAPAKRSRNLLPVTSASMLNRASLTASAVGLRTTPGGFTSRRPFALPPMTLILTSLDGRSPYLK